MDRLLEQADELRRSGQYDKALSLYEQVLAEQPELVMGWSGLAHTVMNQGEFELALQHFQRAAALAPQEQRVVYDIAMLHTMLGDYDKARPLFSRVVEIDPKSKAGTEAQKQLSYY